MTPDELKQQEFFRLKRGGYLEKVSDLKSTERNLALIAVEIVDQLNKRLLFEFTADIVHQSGAKENSSMQINIFAKEKGGLSATEPPSGELFGIVVFKPSSNFALGYSMLKPSFTLDIYWKEYDRILKYVVGDVLNNPVPEEWYLAVDL